MNLHNRSRFYCQKRIAELDLASYNWTEIVAGYFWLKGMDINSLLVERSRKL